LLNTKDRPSGRLIAMPAAEITAGITSVRAAYDLTKAMTASRDAKLLANGARDLQLLLGEAIFPRSPASANGATGGDNGAQSTGQKV
jgi:hypothetical protein